MKQSLFWEFQLASDERPSLIVGTIHLGTPQALVYWERIAQCIDSYDHIYTESSLSPEGQEMMSKYVFYNEKDVFLKYITPNRWRRMVATFKTYFNIDIEQMRDMRPLFILSAIYQSMQANNGPSLDQRIWSYATSTGKSVEGIESTQEQIQIMLGLSNQLQYRQLVRLSKKVKGFRAKFLSVLDTYQEQDILKMLKLAKHTIGIDKVTLLHQRNELIAQRIVLQHRRAASFFSFGAGHLAGANGVLAILKRQGVTLKARQ